jgi:hypothetical protein
VGSCISIDLDPKDLALCDVNNEGFSSCGSVPKNDDTFVVVILFWVYI